MSWSRSELRAGAACAFLGFCVFVGPLFSLPGLQAQVAGKNNLRPPGVTPVVEASIKKGLSYLARAQESDGSYGKSTWSSNVYPTAMTSLSGLAFLASGSTPTRGPYARNLQKITSYLLNNCVGTYSYAPGLIAN
ncbi:MAG: hypothetical protein VYB34_16725, partial [Planctomycetota bacterium]|nr:hypothetical protein [Planctomycetota bacterium]